MIITSNGSLMNRLFFFGSIVSTLAFSISVSVASEKVCSLVVKVPKNSPVSSEYLELRAREKLNSVRGISVLGSNEDMEAVTKLLKAAQGPEFEPSESPELGRFSPLSHVVMVKLVSVSKNASSKYSALSLSMYDKTFKLIAEKSVGLDREMDVDQALEMLVAGLDESLNGSRAPVAVVTSQKDAQADPAIPTLPSKSEETVPQAQASTDDSQGTGDAAENTDSDEGAKEQKLAVEQTPVLDPPAPDAGAAGDGPRLLTRIGQLDSEGVARECAKYVFADFEGDGREEIVAITAVGDRLNVYKVLNGRIELAFVIPLEKGSVFTDIGVGHFLGGRDGDQLVAIEKTENKTTFKVFTINVAAKQLETLAKLNKSGDNRLFTALSTGDFDGDGRTDFTAADNLSGRVYAYRLDNQGSIAHLGISEGFTSGTAWVSMAASDLNGDGRDELVGIRAGDSHILVMSIDPVQLKINLAQEFTRSAEGSGWRSMVGVRSASSEKDVYVAARDLKQQVIAYSLDSRVSRIYTLGIQPTAQARLRLDSLQVSVRHPGQLFVIDSSGWVLAYKVNLMSGGRRRSPAPATQPEKKVESQAEKKADKDSTITTGTPDEIKPAGPIDPPGKKPPVEEKAKVIVPTTEKPEAKVDSDPRAIEPSKDIKPGETEEESLERMMLEAQKTIRDRRAKKRSK